MLFNRKSILDDVVIAAPCSMDWDSMEGDDKVRFCSGCDLNVYNISGMKQKEAEQLLEGSGERVCVRLFRRKDGTLITQDCPVGKRIVIAVRKKIRAAAFALGTLLHINTLMVAAADSTQNESTSSDCLKWQKEEIRRPQGFVFAPNQWRKEKIPPKSYQAPKYDGSKVQNGEPNPFEAFKNAFGKPMHPPSGTSVNPSSLKELKPTSRKQNPEIKTYPRNNRIFDYPPLFPTKANGCVAAGTLARPRASLLGKDSAPALKQNADVTALHAFVQAQDFEDSDKKAEACQSYEAALRDFKGNDAHDPMFKKMVAKKYAQLLRSMNNESLAKQVESEFKPDGATKN